MENARSKVVFSLSLRDRNLTPLADWLYSGTYDPAVERHLAGCNLNRHHHPRRQ